MATRLTRKQLEQRVKELEREALEYKQTEESLRESTRRLEIAYDQSIIYAGQLAEKIKERKEAEEALQNARKELEVRVEQRTAELSKANALLKEEIAERRAAEEALRIEKDNLVNVLNSMEDGVYIINHQCDLEYVNPTLMREFGPFEGKKCYTYFHHRSEVCPWCRNEDVFAGNTVRWEWKTSKSRRTYEVIDTLVKKSDGSMAKLEILRDVTERKEMTEEKKRLEAELQKAHRMEALGTLASGVANAFYEIIGIIVGNTELALYETAREHSAQHNLEEVLKACMRAEDVVSQILTFGRQGERRKEALMVSHVVEEAIGLLHLTLPTTIQIRQNTQGQTRRVLADPVQMRQVVMNLCTNAAWAMREKGGVLEVGLSHVDLEGVAAVQYPDVNPGPYVRLTVSDTGHGIEPDIIEQIFDPYFTTKQVGTGSGMGLAVVYGIVESHGGTITVDSEVGKGTTFHVFFPEVEGKDVHITEASEHLLMGNERILFVDDEQAIVDMGKQMLESLGYEVVALSSSTEALETFRIEPDRFDLVITDQIMPHMRGEILAQEILRIRPDVPIILCTVRTEPITKEEAEAMGIRGFVVKPVVTRVMAEAIRDVLQSKGSFPRFA